MSDIYTHVDDLKTKIKELEEKLSSTQKVTIDYYLPEGQHDLDLALRSREYYLVLCDLQSRLRAHIKWGDLDDKTDTMMRELYSLIPDLD